MHSLALTCGSTKPGCTWCDSDVTLLPYKHLQIGSSVKCFISVVISIVIQDAKHNRGKS